MEHATEFLERNLASILHQTHTDYEIVISDDSEDDSLKSWLRDYPVKYFKNKGPHGMAYNTNNAIDKAQGRLVKILFQDDYLYNEFALDDIDHDFNGKYWWLATGCVHDFHGQLVNVHYPFYSESDNTIGSPSVVTFKREAEVRFDPNFHWVLDLDFYRQMFRKYGKVKLLNKIGVVIGLGGHQTTNKLSDQRKALEHQLLRQKYDPSAPARL